MALNVATYKYDADSKYLECKKQFRQAHKLILDHLIRDAKRFIDNLDEEVYEFAITLSDSHHIDELKTLIDFVFLSIEINKSKLWKHHMSECKKEMDKINWQSFDEPVVYPSFLRVMLWGDLYEVVTHRNKKAFFKASGLRLSMGETEHYYLFLSDCETYVFQVPKKTVIDNRHFTILPEKNNNSL